MPDNSMRQGSDTPTGQTHGNPWHDPKNGQFTSGPASATDAQSNAPADSGDEIVVTASKAARDAARTANYTQGTRPPHSSFLGPPPLLAAIEKTGKLSASEALTHADHAARFRDMLISKYKLSAPLATAMAASAELESRLDEAVKQSGKAGLGRGLFQLTDPARKASFLTFTKGTPIQKSTADQQIRYQIYELTHSERHTFSLAQQVGSNAASLAAGYSFYVERSASNLRDSADRYAVASALDRIPVK